MLRGEEELCFIILTNIMGCKWVFFKIPIRRSYQHSIMYLTFFWTRSSEEYLKFIVRHFDHSILWISIQYPRHVENIMQNVFNLLNDSQMISSPNSICNYNKVILKIQIENNNLMQ